MYRNSTKSIVMDELLQFQDTGRLKVKKFVLSDKDEIVFCTRAEFIGGDKSDFVRAFERLSIEDRKFLFDNVDGLVIEYEGSNKNKNERFALIIPEELVAVFTLAGVYDFYAIAGACGQRILGSHGDTPFSLERWCKVRECWYYPLKYRSYVHEMRSEFEFRDESFYSKSYLEDEII